MKKITLLIFALFICLNITAQQKNTFIKITFYEGDLKGTHIFYPEKGNYASQINLQYFKGVSNLNASKIISNKGLQIHYINRHFIGEATIGTHKAKKHTSGCGSLNFIDLKNNKSYKKIDGDFTGCSTTSIYKVTPWKKGIVKHRRKVSGKFTDTLSFSYTMDNGSKKTLQTKASVVFTANESRNIN